jgi:DTW domain-containing protein YfiP
VTDAYALASPHADRADEAPGIPLRSCPRCRRSFVQTCPCSLVPELTHAAKLLLVHLRRRSWLPVGYGRHAAALASYGLLEMWGANPTKYSLTPLGQALAREAMS